MPEFYRELAAVAPELRNFARSNGLQAADAEDVAQEVMVRAVQHRQDLGGPSHLRGWCYRVCRNLTTDLYRSRSRTDLVGDLPEDDHDLAPDPASEAEYAEQLELGAKALRALCERDQAVLRRVDINREPSKRVAADLGITEANLRQVRKRAQASLRKEFLKLGGTAAGLLILFPGLRSADKVRTLAMTAATPLLLAATLLVEPFTTHHDTSPAILPPPVTVTSTVPDADREPVGHGLTTPPSPTASPLPLPSTLQTSSAYKPSIVSVVPDGCVSVGGGGVCSGTWEAGPEDNYVGIFLSFLPRGGICGPTYCIPRAVGASEDIVDLSPACNTVKKIPYTECYREPSSGTKSPPPGQANAKRSGRTTSPARIR